MGPTRGKVPEREAGVWSGDGGEIDAAESEEEEDSEMDWERRRPPPPMGMGDE